VMLIRSLIRSTSFFCGFCIFCFLLANFDLCVCVCVCDYEHGNIYRKYVQIRSDQIRGRDTLQICWKTPIIVCVCVCVYVCVRVCVCNYTCWNNKCACMIHSLGGT